MFNAMLNRHNLLCDIMVISKTISIRSVADIRVSVFLVDKRETQVINLFRTCARGKVLNYIMGKPCQLPS